MEFEGITFTKHHHYVVKIINFIGIMIWLIV